MNLLKFLVAASAVTATISQSPQAQEGPTAKGQKRLEKLVIEQSLTRLQETRNNLKSAITKIADSLEATATKAESGRPDAANIGVASATLQQAEQALVEVRRAIDELDVPESRRQEILNRLDDADSAMRMARQPNANDERKRLQQALMNVQEEIKVAWETLRDKTPAGDH